MIVYIKKERKLFLIAAVKAASVYGLMKEMKNVVRIVLLSFLNVKSFIR